MAIKRMLVDAIHPEETRIVVTSGSKLEEFDFEAASRRQLRGNIYLAKVTRVEPSLQAAFVEYGGNRHGFLAFSEIHPDYYQIPVADREALLRDEEEEAELEAEAVEATEETDADEAEDADAAENGHDAPLSDTAVDDMGGGEDALEEVPQRRRTPARRYKIQEVIKRRQVMLVQVVKEERGNKGAALTTYLSLAGRYSVLMPNTARGGGISRKITSSTDRRRLKEIAGELEVPQGMGIILRTAGAARTKAEVKRDFEYLLRLWENVRSLTLQSTAPSLVYEEGSLIKRTIRDLYNKDIDEVWVAGDGAYREAKDFMRMIMPSHAKNVQAYSDDQSIFSKYNVEPQLDAMFSPQVTLPSGGYIVINPTEALVSIDVNSGRATKEHNIEDTAFQTNMEASEEIARQLRLRDLAGLIVIDFIDMMEKRSIRNVERRLKDCLKNDRARIQVGRISHFGLMEMSRQRMRFGVLESSTHSCPLCHGTGLVRSTESVALMVMRSIEDYVMRHAGQSINVKVPTEIALYILNSKRGTLGDLETRHNLSITVTADAALMGNHFSIDRGETRPEHTAEVRTTHVRVDSATVDEVEEDVQDEPEEEEIAPAEEPSARRGRRGRRGGRQGEPAQSETVEASETPETVETAESGEDEDQPRRRRRRGRRGGRRNRRGPNAEAEANTAPIEGEQHVPQIDHTDAEQPEGATAEAAPQKADASEGVSEATPARTPRRSRGKKAGADAAPAAEETAPAEPAAAAPPEAPAIEDEPAKKPRRSRKKKTDDPVEGKVSSDSGKAVEGEKAGEPKNGEEKPAAPRRAKKELPPDQIVVTSTTDDAEAAKPKKGGWWQRGLLG
jgi:ribonuclease E